MCKIFSGNTPVFPTLGENADTSDWDILSKQSSRFRKFGAPGAARIKQEAREEE